MVQGRRRVVVTGIGLVTPLGIGTRATWDALLSGRSGVGPITRFDASDFSSRIAGEVKGFDPLIVLEKKELKKTDLFIQFALAAAQFAVDDSGLELSDEESERAGAIIGSGIGGLPVMERNHDLYRDRGPGRISPFFIPAQIANMAAGMVTIRHGLKGPSGSPCTACTTGLHAIGDAYRLIQHGYADVMMAGGAEGSICAMSVGGFCSMRALSTRNDEPERACRPWDRDRDGFVVAEGAGILVLEEEERARSRGAPIYCSIEGYGMSSDAYHISAPHPEGDGAYRVMKLALEDSGIAPESVEYVNAHGTSTGLGDLAEVKAAKRLFGDHAYHLAMSSTKSSTGHLLGAAGGLESGLVALALRDQVLPATLNLENPDPEADLDFVPLTPREQKLEIALTNSFGFGGTNGAVVFKKHG